MKRMKYHNKNLPELKRNLDVIQKMFYGRITFFFLVLQTKPKQAKGKLRGLDIPRDSGGHP